MRKLARLSIALTPAIAVLLLWSLPVTATPEMGRKENKSCVTCHTGKGLYTLNDVGKYYQKNKKLPPDEQKGADSAPMRAKSPRAKAGKNSN
ncbi:MAG: hypothetical protein LC114_03165 [Bryobacterales bacterium]|nr:hypothetical protein [Bryobacterales bacterium]